jgi:hypothetical protein
LLQQQQQQQQHLTCGGDSGTALTASAVSSTIAANLSAILDKKVMFEVERD